MAWRESPSHPPSPQWRRSTFSVKKKAPCASAGIAPQRSSRPSTTPPWTSKSSPWRFPPAKPPQSFRAASGDSVFLTPALRSGQRRPRPSSAISRKTTRSTQGPCAPRPTGLCGKLRISMKTISLCRNTASSCPTWTAITRSPPTGPRRAPPGGRCWQRLAPEPISRRP